VGAFTIGNSARAQDANHFVAHIINDGADLYVTLLDQNAGSAAILSNVRLNHQDSTAALDERPNHDNQLRWILDQMSRRAAVAQAARCSNKFQWMPLLRHTQT